MNIIITESQYSRIFLLEEDYRQTFKKYITNKNQGNTFRQWVRKNTDKYNLLVARMKQAKYSDPSLGPSGDITSPHIMLAWKMFGNDYINRNNVQSSGLSKQAQQDWQARQTMNKYFDPSNPDYVGKDHQVIDNTARLQSNYDSKTNTWSTKGNTNAGFSEREAANLAGVNNLSYIALASAYVRSLYVLFEPRFPLVSTKGHPYSGFSFVAALILLLATERASVVCIYGVFPALVTKSGNVPAKP